MGLFDFLKKLFGSSNPSDAMLDQSLQQIPDNSIGPTEPNPTEEFQSPYGDFDDPSIHGTQPAVVPQYQSQRPAHPDGSPTPPVRSQGLSGLNSSKFEPMTSDEALSTTETENWKTAYLDPLNVIPPADLPRIRVIDRTMVSMGLISSEELEKIHSVGEEMDRFRLDYSQIAHAGDLAVVADQRERERQKTQKKKEAAERKAARQAEISHRHATDITFLGRSVSAGLADRHSNLEKLAQLKLPQLSAPADVAKWLNISVPRLRWLAFHSEAATRTHYFTFSVPKKSGGMRTISAPHRDLAATQRLVFQEILAAVPTHDSAHGFVQGRSTVTNALQHVGAEVLINVDLKEFFPTINFHRVAGLFRSFGYSAAVATILGLLCTESKRQTVRFAGKTLHVAHAAPSLPQGACTSPAISNLVSRNLDKRFAGFAAKLGWSYTRYADDLSFSVRHMDGQVPDKLVGYLLAKIRHVCEEEGFVINPKKTRVLRNHTQQSVTGIVVNDRPGINRKLVRRIRSILHHAKTEGLESQNREQHSNFRGWITGMISYIEMVNPAQAKKLRDSYLSLI